jgi:tetratricopeptide (TPR) repeat protein
MDAAVARKPPAGQQVLQELDDALAAARSADDRVRLLALRVFMLSRMYRPYEAAAALEQAESHLRSAGTRQATAWTLFARGSHAYFTSRSRESIAAFEACASMARELDLPELNGMAYGAQAFSYLKVDELRNAFDACMKVNALGEAAGPVALYLLHLALGSIRQGSGDLGGALEHFGAAGQHASRAGDPLAVVAMMARSAGIEAWLLRRQAARGDVGARAVEQALANLRGAINEAAEQETHAGLPELHLLEGAMLMLQRHYGPALATYDEHMPAAQVHGLRDDLVLARSDRARCMLGLGHVAAAVQAARDAVADSELVSMPDVRAIVLGNLAYVLWASGAYAEAEAVAAQAANAWDASEAKAAAALTSTLAQIGDNPPLDE